ncbi:MAG: hypothetical protein ACRDRL_10630 [Sciscionella sp.]
MVMAFRRRVRAARDGAPSTTARPSSAHPRPQGGRDAATHRNEWTPSGVARHCRRVLGRLAGVGAVGALVLLMAGTPEPAQPLGWIGGALAAGMALLALLGLRAVPLQARPQIWHRLGTRRGWRVAGLLLLASWAVLVLWSVAMSIWQPGLLPVAAAMLIAAGAGVQLWHTDRR